MDDNWVVYSRAGCTLCDDFLQELANLLGDHAHRVQVVDVDSERELVRKYSDRVPVLCIDGDFVCAHRLDGDRVKRYL